MSVMTDRSSVETSGLSLHPEPDRPREGARGAIRTKWAEWRRSGLLDFVTDYFSSATNWDEIRPKLA
jgi:hypothetical protein